MSSQVIHLTIAGFIITLQFPKEVTDPVVEKLKDDIQRTFADFISPNNDRRSDFIIQFISDHYYQVYFRKENKSAYINFYIQENSNHIRTFTHISTSQFQLILQTVLLFLLAKNDGFILHASASCIKGKAVIFTGNSDAGKSTAMSLLHPQFPSLADDTVIIRRQKKKYYLHQTPFPEKKVWVKKNSNRYLLDKVFFLRKALSCSISKKVEEKDILPLILEQVLLEKQHQKKFSLQALKFVSHFHEFYQLQFSKDSAKLRGVLTEEVH